MYVLTHPTHESKPQPQVIFLDRLQSSKQIEHSKVSSLAVTTADIFSKLKLEKAEEVFLGVIKFTLSCLLQFSPRPYKQKRSHLIQQK